MLRVGREKVPEPGRPRGMLELLHDRHGLPPVDGGPQLELVGVLRRLHPGGPELVQALAQRVELRLRHTLERLRAAHSSRLRAQLACDPGGKVLLMRFIIINGILSTLRQRSARSNPKHQRPQRDVLAAERPWALRVVERAGARLLLSLAPARLYSVGRRLDTPRRS